MDAAGDKLMAELRAVVAAAEELLAAAESANAERLKELEEQMRKHPFAALGIAAAAGFVLGVLLARK